MCNHFLPNNFCRGYTDTDTFDLDKTIDCLFSIFDTKGSRVYTKTLNLNQSSKTFSLDISTFIPGIYYVNILTDDKVHTKKLIIQ